ncbi:MAG: DUF3291 domain-containing protein [Pseudomonadota bacterium]
MSHLAEFNIGRLNHDAGDPRGVDYVAVAAVVNEVAERSPGFVWKYETELGGGIERLVDGDPRVVVNLSVWEDADALEHFVWNTLHKKIYLRRDEWFEPLSRETMVLWHVAEGHRPTLDEAMERLDALRENGPTERAFDWAHLKAECGSALAAE